MSRLHKVLSGLALRAVASAGSQESLVASGCTRPQIGFSIDEPLRLLVAARCPEPLYIAGVSPPRMERSSFV
jgi:hypothetical protein